MMKPFYNLKTFPSPTNYFRMTAARNKQRVEVLLVGGSSKLPMIQAMLRDVFPGKDLNERIDPYHAIAYGAAIRAVQLSSHRQDEVVVIINNFIARSILKNIYGQ
jgi:molecular chaperone DnaK (HSP70)